MSKLQMPRKPQRPTIDDLTAIDLFSGAGGISLGLEEAGFRVLAGSDFDSAAAKTYRRNFPSHAFLEGDIRELTGRELLRDAGIAQGELDLLIGGPPCQGYSIIGSRLVLDPRNNLFEPFLRIAAEVEPRCLVMENVPGLATLGRGRILEHIVQKFKAIGYNVSFAELLAAQYGVPQMRWRMIFIAFRGDAQLLPYTGFPQPTHGKRGIGQLVPNCTVTSEDSAGFITTREAIGDLPAVEAGALVDVYTGAPTFEYQKRMRAGASHQLHNHYAPKLSSQNLNRIAALEPGDDWRDLPHELLPESMQRAKRKDHTRRYSRMTWEGIPRSIITRFRDPKSGEYSHPSQNRTISIREAARIQSFPDRFVFEGSYSEQYDQVGNAVPPILAEAIAREIRLCLAGEPTHQLTNPFSRRKNLLQTSFAFDPP